MLFENLGLRPELLSAIKLQGYKTATPIQAKSIPHILKGRDVLAGAQTGTGKTAAFALPIIQMLGNTNTKSRHPKALIITPTRELAAQILECIEKYSQNYPVRSTVIFGGVNINPQKIKLKKGIDILVSTPGRLLDHVGQKTLDLSKIEILVLDEADRMLDMGFINDIKKVIKLVPKKRQNLLFSATYSEKIKKLASGILVNPEFIEAATPNKSADKVSQVMHPVAHKRKKNLLSKLIKEENWKQTLVFTKTKRGANRLSELLVKDGITSAAIHGNKSQSARTKALASFKIGEVSVLVATDIAARGLDINLLPHVVNYDMPDVPENYVHRIGRTGRAGASGRAVSLVCPENVRELRDIEKLLKTKIPVEIIEGYDIDLTEIPEPKKASARTTFNHNWSNTDKNIRRSDAAKRGYNDKAPKSSKSANQQRGKKNYSNR